MAVRASHGAFLFFLLKRTTFAADADAATASDASKLHLLVPQLAQPLLVRDELLVPLPIDRVWYEVEV